MWRTHKNRVDRGLGPTWSGTGYHESMKQDFNINLPNSSVNTATIIDGRVMEPSVDNPFLRWHKSYEDYDAFLHDVDDVPFTFIDEYERIKKYRPQEKNVVGVAPIIPLNDDDEAYNFYDI